MRFLGRVLLVILVLVAIGLGLTAWGYSSVEVELNGVTSIEPKLKVDFQSALSALGHVALGDFLGASSQLITGVIIKGTIDVHNGSYVPLYTPELEHQLIVDDEPVGKPFHTQGGWLGPRGQRLEPIEVVLPLSDLPELVLKYIFTGGNLPLGLQSTLQVGPLSFSKTSTTTADVANPIASAPTFSMDSYGFSPGTVLVSDTTTASVTISGGDPGQYTVRLWRDINLAPDEKVGEFSFHHDGSTTTATNPFTPSSSGTYHMDLVYGAQMLWSQPNDASRLTVIS